MREGVDSDFSGSAETYRIVRADPSHAETLAALRVASRAELHAHSAAELEIMRATNREFFERKLTAGDGFLYAWLAYDGDRAVGTASLTVVPTLPRLGTTAPVDGRIRNVFVEASYRRRGIAARLMREVIAQARRLDVDRLTLGSSTMGRPLYEALGFVAKADEMLLPTPGYKA